MDYKKLLLMVVLICSIGSLQATDRRSNPIVSHMFTADPSAHVWNDGRLYVYPSTDVSPPSGYGSMDGYHVFSTDDLITWIDHGEILHSDDVDWGREAGGFMWAPDCVYRNGAYTFFFPHKNTEDVWEIGIATSSLPATDFKVQGYLQGGTTFCDPGVFIDDDGQAYLYAVSNVECYVGKLTEDLRATDGEMILQTGLEGFREGPFVFKRQGIYYLIYPDDYPDFNKMRYAMSKSPLGPWDCMGVFLDSTDVKTTHGSCVEFEGQWYVFYHNGSLSGGQATNRSICFDPMYFNDDGTIQMVKQSLGVELPTFHQDINFNRMFGSLEVGAYTAADLAWHGIAGDALSSIEVPPGYVVECFADDQFKGKSWRFENNVIDLGGAGGDDVVSSIVVSRLPPPTNLVKNGSFELGVQQTVAYWQARRPENLRHVLESPTDGYYALRYDGERAARDLTQTVSIKPNTYYQLSASLKIAAGSVGRVSFDIMEQSGAADRFELSADERSGEWVRFTRTFNSGTSDHVTLRCGTSQTFAGTCFWDDVVVSENTPGQ